MSKNKANYKAQAIIRLLIAIGILIAVNVLSYSIFTRFDLTKEKRFSLTNSTKDMLGELEDVVYFKVYLEGDFESGFKRLQTSTQEMLDEFRVYGGNNIQYEFLDPLADASMDEKKMIVTDLASKGLLPQTLVTNNEEYSERVIIPGAMASYRGREVPVPLLLEQTNNKDPQVVLNNSVSLLEYQLGNAVQKLMRRDRPAVAFLEGQGELAEIQVQSIANALAPYYVMERYSLKDNLHIPPRINALVIAKPMEKFDEVDKFKIDQYIMNGGKVLWLVETLRAEMDSLSRNGGKFIALDYGLNIEDQLFKYGVRINPNLVEDAQQCNVIPLVIGTDQSGNARQTRPFQWPFFPIITNMADNHPITKNIDAVNLAFASSIDTIRTKNDIKKTVLMTTSQYSKTIFSPARIDVNTVRSELNMERYNKPDQIVGVLLEGSFESAFKGRLAPETIAMIDTIKDVSVLEESKPTKMIVISDGDIIKNDIDRKTGRPAPLGYYKFTGYQFANKDLLINAIDYLTDDKGLIISRSKDVKLRLLDNKRAKEEKMTWQLINIGFPLLLLMLFGLAYNFLRKRKYER